MKLILVFITLAYPLDGSHFSRRIINLTPNTKLPLPVLDVSFNPVVLSAYSDKHSDLFKSFATLLETNAARGRPEPSPLPPVALPQLPLFSGYLEKQGEGPTGLLWKKRWFCLRDGLLYYAASQQDYAQGRHRGIISLKHVLSITGNQTVQPSLTDSL